MVVCPEACVEVREQLARVSSVLPSCSSRTQVVRLGSKSLYPESHLPVLKVNFSRCKIKSKYTFWDGGGRLAD